MAKDLVIVESPTKARTLTRILGGQYEVQASMGHVRDLPERGLGIALDHTFAPTYEVPVRKKKVIADLTRLAKGASCIWLATDADREGEAIAWHLQELLKTGNKKASFQRVTFHEITKPAVLGAFQHPSVVDQPKVDAQQARRVLDRLVGYQVSPLLWKRVTKGTSAGRVQSVALRLICEREAQVTGFQQSEYWNLLAHFLKVAGELPFQARLFRIDGKRVESGDEKAEDESKDKDKDAAPGEAAAPAVPLAERETIRLGDAATAESYAKDAEKGRYAVSAVNRQPRQRRAPPPFITSTLQQAASANIGMSPEQTMRVAQELYEGVDTGNGPAGLITYMRTDSVNIAKEAQEAARRYIGGAFGPDFVPAKPNFYKSRGAAQEAHEAIRPTDVTLTPEQAAKYLDERQTKLYRLIWQRFLASQMAPARLLLYTVEVASARGSCQHLYTFRASSTTVQFPGYLKVYSLHDTEEDKDEASERLPELVVNDACRLTELERQQKFTEPPPRFSEATLVRELERNGIGRPSTYAPIVNTLKEREYVRKERGKLIPTDLGQQVNTFLVSTLPALFDVGFTARMEAELDEVEAGKVQWAAMIGIFYENFTAWLGDAGEQPSPPVEIVAKLLAAYPANIAWQAPEKIRGRGIDHAKFFASFKEATETNTRLTPKQWQALLTMTGIYASKYPVLAERLRELGFGATLDQARERQEARAAEAAQGPDPENLKLLAPLEAVTDWQKDKRGKKVYDDKKFYESLRDQVQTGRKLSEAQVGALKKLLVKYHSAIPDFDAVATAQGIEKPAPPSVDGGRLQTMLDMLAEVKDWGEKAAAAKGKAKGHKPWDAQEFVSSLTEQFKRRGSLSERQIAVLAKLVAEKAPTLTDGPARLAALGLAPAAPRAPRGEKGAPRPAAVTTDVTCPQCQQGKLAERNFRGRRFYGCNRYPECKFAVSSLSKVPGALPGNEA